MQTSRIMEGKMRSREEIKDFLKQMQHFEGTLLQRAYTFAEFAHDGQFDKAGQSYIQHPVRVAERAAANYDDDNLTAIAYMHDVIEDGNFTASDLSAYFPKVVWATVDLLTRRKSEDREKYIKTIGTNLVATKVKIADLEDNMDLTRLAFVTEKDKDRNGRYIDEYRYLKKRLEEMESTLTEDEQDSEFYCEWYM